MGIFFLKLYTFNILTHFFIIYMAYYPFEKCYCVHFLRGEGLRNCMFLYTDVNVDNYGWPCEMYIVHIYHFVLYDRKQITTLRIEYIYIYMYCYGLTQILFSTSKTGNNFLSS